ncbi:MAG: tetratricopeptide repeat protein [Verrucomicrobia bacterium]|nr:tetratricopeptide repeat protein [Verrucomicrobiota bacterium]
MIRRHLPCGLKPALLLATVLAALATARADETPPSESLRQGLYQEEVKRDPEAAAKHYQEVLEQYARQQAVAATALFRLAEVRRGQGKNDDAIRLYQQLLAGFPQAAAEGKLARERLTELGAVERGSGSQFAEEEARQIEAWDKWLAESPELARKSDLLETAVRKRWMDVVRHLLEKGMDRPQVAAGLTAASGYGFLDFVKCIVETGKPDTGALNSALAVSLFAEPPHPDVARYLLGRGASPDAVNNDGNPVIGRVVWLGDVELLKELLKRGVNLHPKITFKARHQTGRRNPFTPTTNKEEEVPYDLMGWFKPGPNAPEIATLLLDAGLKAGTGLVWALDAVARLDETGDLVRRLLAQRPDHVDVAEMPDITEWKPASRRVFLDEVLIPALSKEKGVLLLDATTGRWQSLTNNDNAVTWPTLEGLLWQNLEKLVPDRSIYETTADRKRKYKTVNYWPKLTVFQTSAEGITRTVVPLKSAEPLPPLRPDMVIEFDDEGEPSVKSLIEPALDWHLRKRVRVPVTIEQDGKSREMTMCGNLLVFDPTSAEIPLLNIGALARMFLPRQSVDGDLALKSGTIFTILRKDGRELRLDAGDENSSSFIPTDVVTRSYLQAGDRLIIPQADWELMRTPVTTGEHLPPIRVAVPEWSFHRSYFMGVKNMPTPPQTPALSRSPRPSERTPTAIQKAPPPSYPPPTLFELLADVLSPELDRFVEDRKLGDDDLFATLATESSWSFSVVLPHPDFSSVLIKRPKDGGGETVLKVDLTPIIARCQDDTDPAEIRKADVPLLPGDTMEFSLRADKPSQPWTGLSPAEERLFRKAIGGKITLREPDGVIHDFDLVYQQPAWRATPAGLLPFAPETGSPSTRASRVRFPQRSTGGIFRDEATIDGASFLREGDRMRVDFYDHATARVRSSGQIPNRRVPKVLDIPSERGRPAR